MISIAFRQKFATSITLSLLLMVILTEQIPSAKAQSEATSSASSNPAEDTARQNSKVRFSLDSNSRFGSYPFVPDQWCDLHLRLENGDETGHDLLCTSYFETDPSLQYGRQVWVPPHARLTLPHAALIPRVAQDKATSINVSSLVIERTAGADVLLKTESQQLRHDRSLMLTHRSRITGIVFGTDEVSDVPQDVLDLVIGCRVVQRLNNKVVILADDFLPTDENSLRYLDHLVVADNRLTKDSAALAAVRRWLHAGGRLWVMLDRVNPELLERLLGDDFHGHVVDRVGLTSIQIDDAPSLRNPEGEAGEMLTFDEPVDMTRLMVSGMKVWKTVDGWPAAMTMSCGEGRLFVTTVGPRAWIKPTPPGALPDDGPLMTAAYIPRTPMEELSTQVLANREPPLLMTADVESLAREYISYKIPDWTLVASTMGGFLATLVVVGGLLWRLKRLEHFGWSGSLLAGLASLLFLGIAQSNRQGAPSTEATVQLAQAIGGTDDVRSQGAVAVYRSERSQTPIRSSHGGVIEIDMKGLEGVTRRMITTDLDSFYWDGLPQPTGLQLYSEATSTANTRRYEARTTFDAQGLSGRITGTTGAGADVMLATQFGRLGVEMSADGTWSAGVQNILAANQYLAANFLGAEQERRRRILEKLFASKSWKSVLQRPQLLVWLKEWPQGFAFGEGLVQQGQTLLVLPVEFTRPPAGTEMMIPAPLITFGTRRPPDGTVPSGCWDDNLGIWQERSSPCTTWLNFQMPRSLLPATATKVQLEIKASGAIGRIEIVGIRNDAAVRLQEVINPVGTVQIEISDASVLNLSDEGELALGIIAGDPTKAVDSTIANVKVGATADYWKIETVELNVWAKATDGSKKD